MDGRSYMLGSASGSRFGGEARAEPVTGTTGEDL
jgi:hypothetical protein